VTPFMYPRNYSSCGSRRNYLGVEKDMGHASHDSNPSVPYGSVSPAECPRRDHVKW
jgi:hypothetical protein